MRPRISLIALALITLAYAVVRLLYIDTLVTTDEPFWLGRSANFYRALVEGDLANTYQMAHPGVMTMWAGAVAFWLRFPEYAQLAPGNLSSPYSIEAILREMGRDPLELLVAAKVSKIILQTLFFGIALTYLARLAGPIITTIVGMLMVFAPFMSGYDSALHVDGLFTTICFAAILAISFAAFDDSRRLGVWANSWPWLLAGALAGLSVLTRATGVMLIGVVALALGIQVILGVRIKNPWGPTIGRAVTQGLLWLIASVLVIYALLPALWDNSAETLQLLWEWSRGAATEGHENPTFYRGIHQGDPGLLVYPEVLAWRTSPVEWLGVLLLVLFGYSAWRQRQSLSPQLAKTLILMLVFMLTYVVAMSTGAKKFDRYILPAFPVIALFAGTGIALTAEWLRRKSIPRATLIATSLTTVLLLGQAASWASTLPYRLDYYNPVLGGAERAQHVLQMGWGQGGDQVLEYLEEQGLDGRVYVQTTAVTSAFTYFLSPDTQFVIRDNGVGTPAGWYQTDFYVAGIQQTQRELKQSYPYLAHADPVHTIDVGGVPYFEIFDMRDLQVAPQLLAPTACSFTFNDEITLMQIIGRTNTMELYFVSTGQVTGDVITLEVEIVTPGDEVFREEVTFTPAAPGVITQVVINRPPDTANMPLRDAQLTIGTTNGNVTVPWADSPMTHAITTSECLNLPLPE